MGLTTRRRFLTLAIGAGGAFGMGVPARLIAGKNSPTALSPPEAEGLTPTSRAGRAFGTQVSITVLHSRCDVARQALAAAFAELTVVERLMSIYRPDSQLGRLNRVGKLDHPHPYLTQVLRASAAISRRTGGAFDVTVQPLWEVFSQAARSGQTPSDAEVAAARDKVDWRRVEVTSAGIRLRGEATAVTLNGVAQGFAADRVTEVLLRHGIRHALLNTGEIGVLGGKSEDAPWTVGIQHPRREDAYVSLAELRGRCLATSGDYATSFSRDFRDNHLFDPRTGRSPQELASVSVVAGTALEADLLSTAVCVLGPERGLRLLRDMPHTDGLLVRKDGRVTATAGFPATA